MTNKPNYQLPSIPYHKRPKVLLVGNGINLSFSGCKSTDSIICDQWEKHYDSKLDCKEKKDDVWKLPFPMQIVVATKDHVQECMMELSAVFKIIDVSAEQKEFIRKILNVNFDAILTTNYSLEFEKSTLAGYSERRVYSYYKTTQEAITAQQKNLGIFQCTELQDNNHSLLWHIHGTALRKNSMIIGPLYYGKLLSEVTKRANEVNSGYRFSMSKENPYTPKSWIDYFLIGDVYILGFELDFSESDIWWLLNYKKDAFPNTKAYLFQPHICHEKQLLLDCYHVQTPIVTFDEDEPDKYLKYYERVCSQIKQGLTFENSS